jgi:hypothetical protein
MIALMEHTKRAGTAQAATEPHEADLLRAAEGLHAAARNLAGGPPLSSAQKRAIAEARAHKLSPEQLANFMHLHDYHARRAAETYLADLGIGRSVETYAAMLRRAANLTPAERPAYERIYQALTADHDDFVYPPAGVMGHSTWLLAIGMDGDRYLVHTRPPYFTARLRDREPEKPPRLQLPDGRWLGDVRVAKGVPIDRLRARLGEAAEMLPLLEQRVGVVDHTATGQPPRRDRPA